NNRKIGRDVRKGAWSGMPIFTLSLQERATCPRSCPTWVDCYGNAMPFAQRADHTDPQFLLRLADELRYHNWTKQNGFVVRLHVLGDFYSAKYVRFWSGALRELSGLHVFGYTANLPDAQDPGERKIGEAVHALNAAFPDRCAIRFSASDPAPMGAVVVDADPESPDVIVCPAETEKTMGCGTCGLCWAPQAQNKAIAFLRHGM